MTRQATQPATSEREGLSAMLLPTIIMGVIAAVLIYLGYRKGGGEHVQGIVAGLKMAYPLLPLLLFGFLIAGLLPIVVPAELISHWLGRGSGLRGLLVATVVGGLTPGGPFVCFPIVVGLLRAGAGLGAMVAYVTAWSLWAVGRLPLEVAFLGWKFTAVRLASTFYIPPIAGFLAGIMFRDLK